MIVIEQGRVIDPSVDRDGAYDILIEDGVIKDILPVGGFSELSSAKKISAKNKWVVPGFVDLHVHLREPGQEWKETVASGSRAALAGGYTTICCMPNTTPAIHSAEIARYIIEKSLQAGLVHVLPIGAVTIDRKGEQLAPLSELAEAGCVAFSDDGDPVFNAGLMRRALEWSLMLDMPISCHEEDKDICCGGVMNESALSAKLGLAGMPKVAEDVMVARDIELARDTGAAVHFCHVSTSRSVELIRRAKNDNIKVTAEVTPHHLALTEDVVADFDGYTKMSPPLREEYERQGLIEGLRDGTLDAVASDHAPHEDDVKKVSFSEAAMGILGLQTSLSIINEMVHDGLLTPKRAIAVLATDPARAFRLPSGTLQKGRVADITIFDPNCPWMFTKEEIESISTNTPFVGREFKGRAETVIVGGDIKLEGGRRLDNG